MDFNVLKYTILDLAKSGSNNVIIHNIVTAAKKYSTFHIFSFLRKCCNILLLNCYS